MQKNVIVLTCGQSGSSVLTALIARGGFWVGNETKKVGYDTFENSDLVDLDMELLAAAEVEWDSLGKLSAASPIERIKSLRGTFDDRRPLAFIEECQRRQPWIWKDPRLSYTIHYWETLMDVSQCHFVVMGRNFRQAWSGHIIKGKPLLSFSDFKAIHGGVMDVALTYVRDRELPYFFTTFEDLVLEPETVIEELNGFLGTELSLGDLEACYHAPLGQLRWSWVDYLHASVRYRARKAVSKLRAATQ